MYMVETKVEDRPRILDRKNGPNNWEQDIWISVSNLTPEQAAKLYVGVDKVEKISGLTGPEYHIHRWIKRPEPPFKLPKA